jgi:hypothetical protein
MRRQTVYWLAAILVPVFEVDFWIAPHPSKAALVSLIALAAIGFALIADGIILARHGLWRVVTRLRRQ